MFRIMVAAGLFVAASSALFSQTPEQRKKMIETRPIMSSGESGQRKARSMTRLKAEGVPVMNGLPVIENSNQAKKRTTEEIAKRAIAVCITAIKGEGAGQAEISSLVRKYGADKFFSPEEAAFVKNPKPSQQDRTKFAWRYECYWVLLWSLGYVDKLARPTDICNVKAAVGFLRSRDTARFIKDAKLRPIGAILDEADIIYRYHWAVTENGMKNKPAPAKLNGDVVQERHYVLNWLIGYSGQSWDDISTDT